MAEIINFSDYYPPAIDARIAALAGQRRIWIDLADDGLSLQLVPAKGARFSIPLPRGVTLRSAACKIAYQCRYRHVEIWVNDNGREWRAELRSWFR